MDLSIIIVSYNTKKLTEESIKSVYDSKTSLKFEVIVIDNGSSDESRDALKKLQNLYKSLTVLINRDNLGFAKANNQGIKKAIGKYILLLNSDTKVKKGSLRKLVEFAEKTEDAGAVGPKLLNPDGTVQGSAFRLPTILRAIKEYWFGQRGNLGKYVPKKSKPLEVEAISMAAFLITPNAFKKVGYLDEKYFMYFEDLDYCRRLRESGLKVYYLPHSEIIHVHGASGKEIADETNQWRRLIPSSILYHGWLKYQIINFILWTGGKLFKNEEN